MVRTKIVCTLGPSTDRPGVLRRMVRAGMRVARVNTAHGAAVAHARRIRMVRKAAAQEGQPVGILVDLPGPKLRVGLLPHGAMELRRGTRIALGPPGDTRPGTIPVSHPRLTREVKPGEELFLSDGMVKLIIQRTFGSRIFCWVATGGTVRSGSGLNLPQSAYGGRLPTPSDIRGIKFACDQRAEWIGVSFVRSAADLKRVRRFLGSWQTAPLVMAKIEKRQALERLEEIVREADGVMVARGDLGVETPLAEVPIVQKRIIATASAAGKPVITATQMLESMVENPSPTRAEVADIAAAILDGTDAVMLSAETAVGKHPGEATAMLAAVSRATEVRHPYGALLRGLTRPSDLSIADAMSAMACRLSFDVKAKAIIVPAGSSRTAFQVARFRPEAPVLVFSRSALRANQLTVAWNVHPILPAAGGRDWLERARIWLAQRRLGRRGDPVVVISQPLPSSRPGSESLQVLSL